MTPRIRCAHVAQTRLYSAPATGGAGSPCSVAPAGIQPGQRDQTQREPAVDDDLEGAVLGLEWALDQDDFGVRVCGIELGSEDVAGDVGYGLAVAEQLVESGRAWCWSSDVWGAAVFIVIISKVSIFGVSGFSWDSFSFVLVAIVIVLSVFATLMSSLSLVWRFSMSATIA
jgi:hypothetical protein